MATKTKPRTPTAEDAGAINKSISIPKELFEEVYEKKVLPDPEMDFSKYVRGLIRADLKQEKALAT